MSVIGIDMGYQTCYVAVARQGGIETIANECSDRCTPTCVSMGEKSRFMGASAKNQMISNYRNTLWGWKQLIGRKFKDPVVQREKQFLAADIVEGPNGNVGFRVSYLGEQQVFTVEQVTAMMLTKLKEISEAALKTKVVDCVINVPCYFTDAQRRSLLDAAALVGLNALRLMNDTAATALNYGIYKQDLPVPEEKPRHVVFLDMGHSDTQLAVCAFNKGKLTVLATAADPHLGGATFDRLIADYFADDFKARYRVDARSNPKVYLRLLGESERLKKLMSANSQEIPLNIECFMNDKDVAGKMSRATLESLAEQPLRRVEELMRAVLASAKLKVEDIYSVEVVGGSTRIPAIKELVRRVYGKDASTTLNGDEAVARGCALQCAIQSPSFRVRDFTVLDCQPYPIVLSWQGGFNDEGDNSMVVCHQFHSFPFLKQLTFYRKDQFLLEARYDCPDIPPANSTIGSFLIDKVVPQANGDSSKVKVKVSVNMHGIFRVASATMTEKVEPTGADEPMDTEPAVTSNGPASKQPSNVSMQSEEGGKDGGGGSSPEGEPMANGVDGNEGEKKENAEESNGDGTKKGAEPAPEAAPPKKAGPKVKVIDLQVVPRVPRLTPDEINRLMEKESQMVMQDKQEKERVDAKNAVEEYVYDMRKKISGGPMESFMLDKDRAEFLRQLEDTEAWLYEDGEDLLRQAYIDRLAGLKKLGTPVVDRYTEAQERPRAFESLGQALQLVGKAVEAFHNKDEKYDHLAAADIEKVERALAEKSDWLDKQMGLAGRTPPHEAPPVTVSQIKAQRESFMSTCNPIINKPKPKPPKVDPPKEETNKSANNGNDGTKPNDTGDAANGPATESSSAKVDMDLD